MMIIKHFFYNHYYNIALLNAIPTLMSLHVFKEQLIKNGNHISQCMESAYFPPKFPAKLGQFSLSTFTKVS